jgi:hypothetical protein
VTYPVTSQNQTPADVASELLEIERLNRNHPSSAVEPTIEVNGTNVKVSFEDHSAAPFTTDAAGWNPSPQTLDRQIVASRMLFPHASREARRAVEAAASELLTAKVWQSLTRVAGYDPAEDSMVGDIQGAAQLAGGMWIQANKAVRQSNTDGLAAQQQSQIQQSGAAAQQVVADAARTEFSTGVRRRRQSSSSPEFNGSRRSDHRSQRRRR